MLRVYIRPANLVAVSGALVCLLFVDANAAELTTQTVAEFQRYIAVSEQRINRELENGDFLFVAELPEESRVKAYAQLRAGQVLISRITANEDGRAIIVPNALVHNWVGLLFIPSASLTQTLAVVQDYDNYETIYKPEVRRSKLLSSDDNRFVVSLQLYKRSIATVVINGDFDVSYQALGATRVVCRSYSQRLAELQNVGRPDERELPVDDGHGYLWRLYSYWRFEQRDGGVYVQLELIALSRKVPVLLAWIVNPLLKSIPPETISSLLTATRVAVTDRMKEEHVGLAE